MPLGKRAAAELLGTFWLVFGGCGEEIGDELIEVERGGDGGSFGDDEVVAIREGLAKRLLGFGTGIGRGAQGFEAGEFLFIGGVAHRVSGPA